MFFTIGSIFLRKKDPEVKHVKFFIIIGVSLLFYYIIILFLPEVIFVYPLEGMDILVGSAYAITMFVIVPRSLSIIMGITLVIFGSENSERYPNHIFWAGVLFSIGHVMSLFNNLIAYYLSWFDSASLNSYYISYLLISWAFIIELSVSLVFFLLFCVKIKNNYFIVFTLLYYIQLILAFLSSVGLI